MTSDDDAMTNFQLKIMCVESLDIFNLISHGLGMVAKCWSRFA